MLGLSAIRTLDVYAFTVNSLLISLPPKPRQTLEVPTLGQRVRPPSLGLKWVMRRWRGGRPDSLLEKSLLEGFLSGQEHE